MVEHEGGGEREGWRGEDGDGMGWDEGGREWCGVKEGGGAEFTHPGSSLPVSIHGCWPLFGSLYCPLVIPAELGGF